MKLYLGNLPFAAEDQDIRDAFKDYGTIEDLFIPLDRETNRPRGFAFITLADDDLARKAIEEMDGADLMGRNLRVNEAEERRPQQNHVELFSHGPNRYPGPGGEHLRFCPAARRHRPYRPIIRETTCFQRVSRMPAR